MYAVNAGAGLGLATPFKTAASAFCRGLFADRLYDHIKRETFQTRAITSPPRVKRARKRYCACSALFKYSTKVPVCAVACVLYHIKQQKKLRACNVLVMPSAQGFLFVTYTIIQNITSSEM